jgi:hypothetical protein
MHRKLQNTFATCTATAAASLALTFAVAPARAVPVNGAYVEDPRCDPIPSQSLSHELGEVGFFPQNEAFIVNVSPATFTVCVPNDGIQNDWIVDMINVSGIPWTDLFFVADLGMKVGNADGSVHDLIGAPNVLTDAFRIDAIGINPNLLGESQVNDGIFAPGESWRFNVSNFTGPPGTPPFPPIFRTPGVFAGSSPIVIPPTNTASILAIPIPEPTTVGAAGVVAAALLTRRRTRKC